MRFCWALPSAWKGGLLCPYKTLLRSPWGLSPPLPGSLPLPPLLYLRTLLMLLVSHKPQGAGIFFVCFLYLLLTAKARVRQVERLRRCSLSESCTETLHPGVESLSCYPAG